MKKKVVHILNSKAYAGAENVVINIIKKMREIYGYEFLYISPKGNIEDVLIKNNINYILLDKIDSKGIKKVIKSYKPDIIHAHDFTTSIIASKNIKNIPIISHLHNNRPWIKKINLRSCIYYLSSFKYNRILGVSKSIFDEYIFSKSIKSKSVVIGNPIDLQNILKKSSMHEEDIKFYDIVYLGRLSEAKNPERFIEIIDTICNENRNIKAVMIGDGELKEICQNKIKILGLEKNIDMLGFIQNPYCILKNSKVQCMTSKWEGYGLAAIESLSLGVPVVASNVGGLKEIVNEECGKLCNSNDEFVSEIISLISNDDIRACKSKNAKERAEKLDNIDYYMKSLDEIYNSILN